MGLLVAQAEEGKVVLALALVLSNPVRDCSASFSSLYLGKRLEHGCEVDALERGGDLDCSRRLISVIINIM